MRNIVVAASGSVGDVAPYLSVGWELKRRGHHVTLIANPHFRPHAAGLGLAFHPAGTEGDYQAFVNDPAICDWRTVRARAAEYALPTVKTFYEAIAEVHQPGRTVLVAGPSIYGARIIQEQYNTPLATALISPRFVGSRTDPPHPEKPLPGWAAYLARTRRGLVFLGRLHRIRSVLSRRRAAAPARSSPADPVVGAVERIRSSFELPPIRSFAPWRLSPQGVICLWPDWFADRQKDWPRQAVVSGFPLYPPPGSKVQEAPPPACLEDGAKPVVFSCMSVASGQHPFFAAAVEACRILKCRGLLITSQRDQVPRELPPNVSHAEYVPFGELFPRCALVVHHGGIGTTAQAFAAGVPQLVRPMIGDQFDNAIRIQRLGAGKMLAAEHPRPARLARAIDSLLGSERVLIRCKQWQSRIDPPTDLARAVEWIERLTDVRRVRETHRNM